jgi:hypothetical protein
MERENERMVYPKTGITVREEEKVSNNLIEGIFLLSLVHPLSR